MQLTINLFELSVRKRIKLLDLLDLIDEATTDHSLATYSRELEDINERSAAFHAKQGTLPLTETIEVAKPSKPRTKKAETTPTSDEKPKEVSEPTQEVKTPSVSLQEVKELAQAMVAKHDRESVKAIISVYGEKLTEVKESDYQKLFDSLNALND